MKKKMLLVIGVVLIVALVIYARDQDNSRTELRQTAECGTADGGIHAGANGFAIEITQKEATSVTISIAASSEHTVTNIVLFQ